MSSTQSSSGMGALITGGAKRLGRDIAFALSRPGARLGIHYNTSRVSAEALCEELRSTGVEAHPLQANLNEPTAVEPLFDQAWEVLGGVDFLVNNASIFPPCRLDGMELPHLMENLRVNAWAPFLLTRAFWRKIRGTTRRGSVVNLLDTRLAGGDLAHAPYHLSKAMLKEITTLTALDFGPELQVNGVAPGAVLPPVDADDGHLERLTAGLPLRRRGYPKDISDTVLFLLGADYVTGQVIFVDGGRHIRPGAAP